MCRVMEVSTSGYYARPRKRLSKPLSIRRKTLTQLVKSCYWENRRRYGSRRIKAALNKLGIEIGRFAVRRLMKAENLKAIAPKKFAPKTTDSKGTLASPNLLAEVTASECAAGKIIIGDITYLPLKSGKWCYLAMWQDKITRRIIGWSLQDSMTAELIISALQKAISLGLVTRRSDDSFGSGQPICRRGFSITAANQRFPPKYERQRQRFAITRKLKVFSRVSKRS